MQMRVAFQFPSGTEVRYLEHVPRRGDRVRAQRGERFIVSDVAREDGHLAICLTRVEYARDAIRLTRGTRERAQATRARAEETRRRSRASVLAARRRAAEMIRRNRELV